MLGACEEDMSCRTSIEKRVKIHAPYPSAWTQALIGRRPHISEIADYEMAYELAQQGNNNDRNLKASEVNDGDITVKNTRIANPAALAAITEESNEVSRIENRLHGKSDHIKGTHPRPYYSPLPAALALTMGVETSNYDPQKNVKQLGWQFRELLKHHNSLRRMVAESQREIYNHIVDDEEKSKLSPGRQQRNKLIAKFLRLLLG